MSRLDPLPRGRRRGALAGLAVAVTVGALTATAAPAAARPDTRTMTCAEANALVRREGQVVMTTGTYTYRRFVANVGYCDRWQGIKPEYAPSRDNPKCVMHSVCYQPMIPFD
ncbi:hypothetical protein [Acuticoccus mangrovi]|uniref:Secreted protein n=1 Tax=Acuticoccus mangrovi TaxID=2796142 RepID=A0A934ICQ8_9HYPH|nr:hypothetical protein [Acuticoccus mangrovi]MBJ3774124.1 hypothetical protein [Acuticoccus mangrovi]